MDFNTNEKIGKGLLLLQKALKPIVDKCMGDALGKDWTKQVRLPVGYSRNFSLDNGLIFKVMADNWRVFQSCYPRLGFTERGFIGELTEIRNRWAHPDATNAFSIADSHRALETMVLLLKSLDAIEADEVETLRLEIFTVLAKELLPGTEKDVSTIADIQIPPNNSDNNISLITVDAPTEGIKTKDDPLDGYAGTHEDLSQIDNIVLGPVVSAPTNYENDIPAPRDEDSISTPYPLTDDLNCVAEGELDLPKIVKDSDVVKEGDFLPPENLGGKDKRKFFFPLPKWSLSTLPLEITNLFDAIKRRLEIFDNETTRAANLIIIPISEADIDEWDQEYKDVLYTRLCEFIVEHEYRILYSPVIQFTVSDDVKPGRLNPEKIVCSCEDTNRSLKDAKPELVCVDYMAPDLSEIRVPLSVNSITYLGREDNEKHGKLAGQFRRTLEENEFYGSPPIPPGYLGVSRCQARVVSDSRGFKLIDGWTRTGSRSSSKNGTYVNGKRIGQAIPAMLKTGDLVGFGPRDPNNPVWESRSENEQGCSLVFIR